MKSPIPIIRKIRSTYFLFLVLSGLLMTCQRETVTSFDPLLVGTWSSDVFYNDMGANPKRVYFTINGPNSKYEYMCSGGSECQFIVTGRAFIKKDRKTIIIRGGTKGGHGRFVLKKRPYQDSTGVWKCVIQAQGREMEMHK